MHLETNPQLAKFQQNELPGRLLRYCRYTKRHRPLQAPSRPPPSLLSAR
jgi:hypothetical protein